jgi:hypothetical protein
LRGFQKINRKDRQHGSALSKRSPLGSRLAHGRDRSRRLSESAPGQGCDIKIPACRVQFRNDEKRCQKAKIRQCWETAMERLAYCNKTGGEVGWPPLITRIPR